MRKKLYDLVKENQTEEVKNFLNKITNKLEKQKTIDEFNEDGYSQYTSLHQAIFQSNLQIIKILLENSANTELKTIELDGDYKESSENSPLFIASGKGDLEIVKILLQFGANINSTDWCNGLQHSCLQNAIMSDKTEVALYLIKQGADLNHKTGFWYSDCYFTALHYACKKNNFEVVKALVEKGCDIFAKAADGNLSPQNLLSVDLATDENIKKYLNEKMKKK